MTQTHNNHRIAIFAAICGAALLFGCSESTAPAPAAKTKPANPLSPKVAASSWETFHKNVEPFLAKNCYSCHDKNGSEKDSAQLDVFANEAALQKGIETLEKSLEMIQSHKMPPKKKPQPTVQEVAPVVAWIQARLAADCDGLRNPGRVTVRRLNRTEYNNTIQDLLGIDLRPADAFPVDDAGYGFDNNSDVLSVAPVLIGKYLTAASVALERVIMVEPVVAPPVKRFDAVAMEGTVPKPDTNSVAGGGRRGGFGFGGRPRRIFPYNGEIMTEYEFPGDGHYVFRVRGFGTAATNGTTRVRPQVTFLVDGKRLEQTVTVVVDQRNLTDYSFKEVEVKGGKHQVSLAFLNGATAEEDKIARAAKALADAEAAAKAGTNVVAAAPANGRGFGQGRGFFPPIDSPTGKPVLGVVYIEIEGPNDVTRERMPESYQKLMVSMPSATVTKSQAAEKVIRNFARRAFRRPVRDEEVKQFMDLWAKADSDGRSFDQSIHFILQAVMVSPSFLFRIEQEPQPGEKNNVHTLNEFELATRLSYFLWSTMPDEELLSLAEKCQLRTNLDAQLARMIKDPKSKALVDNFGGQWLQFRQMQNVNPDATMFPNFDESLRAAMMKETQMFFTSIMQEDRSILDFLDADYTFVNERLAKHYGIEGIKGEEFQRVSLGKDQRGGVLGQGSVLTLTWYPARTSPVQRGNWVLETLLASPPPPPPPNVPPLEANQAQLKGTLRQRMEQHRTDPMCASCHERMDAIGFGLENYDALGVWRAQDNGADIDASGVLPGGRKFNGPNDLKQILKADSEQFARAVASKMLTYAIGRGMERYDKCTIDDMGKHIRTAGYKFSTVIREVVQSDPFQKRNGRPMTGPVASN